MAKKITAANSQFLFSVKRQFNSKVFAKITKLANEEGLASAKEYMKRIWNYESAGSNPSTKNWIKCKAIKISNGRLLIKK